MWCPNHWWADASTMLSDLQNCQPNKSLYKLPSIRYFTIAAECALKHNLYWNKRNIYLVNSSGPLDYHTLNIFATSWWNGITSLWKPVRLGPRVLRIKGNFNWHLLCSSPWVNGTPKAWRGSMVWERHLGNSPWHGHGAMMLWLLCDKRTLSFYETPQVNGLRVEGWELSGFSSKGNAARDAGIHISMSSLLPTGC
jgi:hypothetical protein